MGLAAIERQDHGEADVPVQKPPEPGKDNLGEAPVHPRKREQIPDAQVGADIGGQLQGQAADAGGKVARSLMEELVGFSLDGGGRRYGRCLGQNFVGIHFV